MARCRRFRWTTIPTPRNAIQPCRTQPASPNGRAEGRHAEFYVSRAYADLLRRAWDSNPRRRGTPHRFSRPRRAASWPAAERFRAGPTTPDRHTGPERAAFELLAAVSAGLPGGVRRHDRPCPVKRASQRPPRLPTGDRVGGEAQAERLRETAPESTGELGAQEPVARERTLDGCGTRLASMQRSNVAPRFSPMCNLGFGYETRSIL
jgi:hypothetical protein